MTKPDAASALSIGIDIGGTTTKLGIVAPDGHLLSRHVLHTQAYDAAGFGNALTEAIQHMIEGTHTSGRILGIGIGAPGVDEQSGSIAAAANLPFRAPFALGKFLENSTGLPTRLVKDSSVAIIGEKVFGGARGMDHFVLLTLGTGLGSALMIHGKVIAGANGLASEYGHWPIIPNGRQCNCGKLGCLETYVSATGIKRTVFELMATHKGDTPLRRIAYEQLEARQIHEAAAQGDPLAQEAFRVTGRILGRAITTLIVLLDPQAVFLAGGLIQAGALLLDPVRESLHEHLLEMFHGSCEVRLSELGGEDTGILGAAAMMMQ